MDETRYESIRTSLHEELRKQGKATDYHLSLADDYVTYEREKDVLFEDIKKTGPRYVTEGTHGAMITKDNKSYGQVMNITKTQLSILKSLGIDENVIQETSDVDDYM